MSNDNENKNNKMETNIRKLRLKERKVVDTLISIYGTISCDERDAMKKEIVDIQMEIIELKRKKLAKKSLNKKQLTERQNTITKAISNIREFVPKEIIRMLNMEIAVIRLQKACPSKSKKEL